MPSDRSPLDIDDLSVLGEEDPGAAMDVFCCGQEAINPLPELGLPELATSEHPPVQDADDPNVSPARVSSIEELSRGRGF